MFDLGKMLQDVSELDTNREQIEYIGLDLIDNDPNNFYQLSGIAELADNIATCGLQQPIRVRQEADKPGRYLIVSGHRRRTAVELLAKDDPMRWKEIPCIVERDTASPALQQLRLIYANSNTRTMTSAELGEQAAQVEKLLYQLKEEGYDFPGRMRDHVAEAVNASKTKLARLRVIRENLALCWQTDYKNAKINESVAYALAQMPSEWQGMIYAELNSKNRSLTYTTAAEIVKYRDRLAAVDRLRCGKDKGPCQNRERMQIQALGEPAYSTIYCKECCGKCPELAKCKNACPLLSEKIQQLKTEKKEQRQKTQEEHAARVQPDLDIIRGVYARVGKVRREQGISVENLYKAQSRNYFASDVSKQEALEDGTAKISENTTLPFGYSFRASDVKNLIAVADLLHCSIDYLLGREGAVSDSDTTADPKAVPGSDTWNTGHPDAPGAYAVVVRYDANSKPGLNQFDWDGNRWTYKGLDLNELPDSAVLFWTPIPGLPQKESPLNDDCITGMNPSGHCGAAAYCAKPYSCCLQCPDPCNAKCGWSDDNVSNSDTLED